MHPNELVRICEAYAVMAENLYRPAAPGDGLGSVDLSKEQLADPEILAREAVQYARKFIAEEDSLLFQIGVSNWETNRALVYVIEAARCLCAGIADQIARRLLELAMEELGPGTTVDLGRSDETPRAPPYDFAFTMKLAGAKSRWNKDSHHDEKVAPPDLLICGLIDGMELLNWLDTHKDWWIIGEWSDEWYAAPVSLTGAGRAALANREPYDMEPVTGGLVEPGWQATPARAGAKSIKGEI